jgi:cobalamin synthase
MLRNVLVVVHAGSGIAGLLAGLWAMAPPRPDDGRGWVRRLYPACIATLFVTLVALIVVDWSDLDNGGRIAFIALAGLAVFMLWRLAQAGREGRTRSSGWQQRYVRHVYFTYVSLWIGFVILPALNSPIPFVIAPLAVATALVVGGILIGRYKRQLASADGD